MKKFFFFTVFLLLTVATCSSQTNVKICDKQPFEWVFATDNTSKIVFQTSYNHVDTFWYRYDTIIGNNVKLTAKLYTSYNLLSIDGDTNVNHEKLMFDVYENPEASITVTGLTLNIEMNPYCKELEILDREDNTILSKMSWKTPPDNMQLDLPPGKYYAILSDNSGANCQKVISVKIN